MLFLFHHHYGTLEFILPLVSLVLLSVLWIASLIRLYKVQYGKNNKGMLALLFIVFPPAGVIWLGREIYLKYRPVSEIPGSSFSQH
ncbi:MAG: hypothetical protein WD097_03630 [Balneolales bacterium]